MFQYILIFICSLLGVACGGLSAVKAINHMETKDERVALPDQESRQSCVSPVVVQQEPFGDFLCSKEGKDYKKYLLSKRRREDHAYNILKRKKP